MDKKIKEETVLMNKVYASLENEVSEAKKLVAERKREIDKGGYDEKELAVLMGFYNQAVEKLEAAEDKCRILGDKPYFAHMRVAGMEKDYCLSDVTDFNEIYQVNNSSDTIIVPFKQDKERPLFSELFHQYQAQDGKSFTVNGSTYNTELIRNTEIYKKTLKQVTQLFPEESEAALQIIADELLAKKLEENKKNPQLQAIIQTLQRNQFEVIRTDEKESFVLQGCAGSGKTQCLIHRLFYLRDILKEDNWKKVLLITPTELFRKYAAELIKRFQLQDIKDCSVSELYYDMLCAFDSRFSKRQYRLKLSEEYLPDGYLREVYSEDNVRKISVEIRNAVDSCVKKGCELAETEFTAGCVSLEGITSLILNLQERIRKFDAESKILSKNQEYSSRLKKMEEIEKSILALEFRMNELEKKEKELKSKNAEFQTLFGELQRAEDQQKKHKEERDRIIGERKKRFSDASDAISINTAPGAKQIAGYSDTLARLMSELDEKDSFVAGYASALEHHCEDAHRKLNEFTGKKTEWLKDNEKAIKVTREKIDKETDTYIQLLYERDDHQKWIRDYTAFLDSPIEKQKAKYRSNLVSARAELESIESTVFEREVWKALAPAKKRYGVPMIIDEQTEDGHLKKTRILYKSDLLFYLKIYQRIRGRESIPQYRLICIDEAQDLNREDYKMLKELFSGVVLNVFGDVSQTLHEGCGVKDWKNETGIDDVYEMNRNYRNTAAIVDFCNKRFGCGMEGFGAVIEGQKPEILNMADTLKYTVSKEKPPIIVKNSEAFENMCQLTGWKEDAFDFLDSNAGSLTEGKYPCYTVFAAKGLEFRNALVYSPGMTRNQKIVACTRAMEKLYYYE